jgi:hypothetical protein
VGECVGRGEAADAPTDDEGVEAEGSDATTIEGRDRLEGDISDFFCWLA